MSVMTGLRKSGAGAQFFVGLADDAPAALTNPAAADWSSCRAFHSVLAIGRF
jgi:hypothetical protein